MSRYKPLPSPPTMDERCGTYAGATAHTYRNEEMCDLCRIAHAEYQRMWRFKTGRQQDLGRCRACGSVFPGHLCAGLGATYRRAGQDIAAPSNGIEHIGGA